MHFTTTTFLSATALLLSSSSIFTSATPTPSVPLAPRAPTAPLTKRTNYWVDSQSGSVATSDCDLTYSNIWGLCTDKGCRGDWETIHQVNLPCEPVGFEDPQCAEMEPQYFCRRVSGAYNGGWADRNGLLSAYFKTNYCYTDGWFFFVGDLGTPEWTALRGDGGAWINVEFKIGINGC